MNPSPVSEDELRYFASYDVLGTLQDRYREGGFSRRLWSRMGDLGLLGMTIPESAGGRTCVPSTLAESIFLFARYGRDLGLALSWITHLCLCAKSIELYGSDNLKDRYLGRLSSGQLVGAMAVSEPGTGTRPSSIETVASPDGDGYVLHGEKVYTTCGPVADVLVVLARTGELNGGKKELTAFVVESGLDGVEARDMGLDFLKTAPHGQITFDGVRLGADSVLAGAGYGHAPVSKTAFARERSCVTAALSGFIAAAADELAERHKQKHESFELDGAPAFSWIHHMSALSVYRLTSRTLVESSFADHTTWSAAMDLLIYIGLSFRQWLSWLHRFIEENEIGISFPLDIILNDMKLVFVDDGTLFREGSKRFMGERF